VLEEMQRSKTAKQHREDMIHVDEWYATKENQAKKYRTASWEDFFKKKIYCYIFLLIQVFNKL